MNQQPDIQPPEIFLRFFRWFCDPEIAEDIEGDLRRRFIVRLQEETSDEPDCGFRFTSLACFVRGL